VASAITGHPAPLSAVVVIGLAASQAAAVQRRVADSAGPLVIAEVDAVTAVLAAAVMTMLRSRGVERGRARVVMAGAESAPSLGPILIACGIGELTNWHHRDAQDYPLTRLIEHNDILIDPDATASMPLAPEKTLMIPHDPFDFGALVLPGLLGALCGLDVAALDIEHLAAAADAVSLLTPCGQLLPELNEPLLVAAIARDVSQALTDRHR
jgi:hypothetical protein